MKKSIEIICAACGADTLIRREPIYEGFNKMGERLTCASCGHKYDGEDAVPYKADASPTIFTEEDKSRKAEVFREDERGRTCRCCRHYVVNPFAQRCGLHNRFIEATDSCQDFENRAAAGGEEQGDGQE